MVFTRSSEATQSDCDIITGNLEVSTTMHVCGDDPKTKRPAFAERLSFF
jgi:hypothetical protein